MILITIVHGVYKPTYNWGAPHCSSNPLRYLVIHSPVIQVLYPFIQGWLSRPADDLRHDHLGGVHGASAELRSPQAAAAATVKWCHPEGGMMDGMEIFRGDFSWDTLHTK